MPRILVLNGSTRAASTNGLFIQAIIGLLGDRAVCTVFPSIADLPHFNPDLDVQPAPTAVARFRELIGLSDAVLICTPEYAMGVPGALKNALDWTVSTADFRQKPVMLVTASLSGEKAHAALLGTLQVIEAVIDPETLVLIPFARTKVDSNARITDPDTLHAVLRALDTLLSRVA